MDWKRSGGAHDTFILLYNPRWSSTAAAASSLNLRSLSAILHAIIDVRTIMDHFLSNGAVNWELEHMQALHQSMHLFDLIESFLPFQ